VRINKGRRIFKALSLAFSARVFAKVLRGFGLILAAVISFAALWFSIVVATIPGERQETALAELDRPQWRIADEAGGEKTKLVSTHDLFFAGEVDETTRRRKSLFSNTLVLPGFNLYEALKIDDPKKLAWKEYLFDLRGRHLEQAVLNGADLTKADLTGAYLERASLDGAQLQGASLNSTHLQGAWLLGAELQGAALNQAQLQGRVACRCDDQGNQPFGRLSMAHTMGEIDQAQLGAVLLDTSLEGWKPIWENAIGSDPIPWTGKTYADLRVSMNSTPDGKRRPEAQKRIEILDCANPDKTLASCDAAAKSRVRFWLGKRSSQMMSMAMTRLMKKPSPRSCGASSARATSMQFTFYAAYFHLDGLLILAAKPLLSWISSWARTVRFPPR
jgi:uncharacterized protein YjbI with pentapeptide repeats